MEVEEFARLQALLGECVQLQKKLMAQANLTAETQRREADAARQVLVEIGTQMRQSATHLENGGQQFGRDAMRIIRDASAAQLEQSITHAVEPLKAQAQQIADKLEWIARTADEQAQKLTRAQTTLAWKAAIALGLGALMLAGGSTAWAWRQKQEADRHQFDADLGRRIRQADITKCGEGLCANVDAKAPRLGDRKQYVPIKSR